MEQQQLKNFEFQSDYSKDDHPHDVLVLKSKTYQLTIRKEFLPADTLNLFRELAAGCYAFGQQACSKTLLVLI
jgi:hypothetical protein